MPDLSYTDIGDLDRRLPSERFSQLVFDDGSVKTYEEAPSDPFSADGWRIAAYALLEAEQEVEDMVSRQYEVPLQRLPAHLKGWLLDIAVYKLHVRTGRVPDGIGQRRDEAMQRVREVGAGELSLNIEEDEGETEYNLLGSGSRTDSTFGDL